MRLVVIILAVVGVLFVGILLLWPQRPATSGPPGADYRPSAPPWLAWLLPGPPAAIPFTSTPPPSSLGAGASWSGRFTAENRELGVVRVRLASGAAVKVTASEPGEEDQLLCIVAAGAPRPGGCGDDNMADGDKGGVVVRKGIATVRIEAPSDAVAIAVAVDE